MQRNRLVVPTVGAVAALLTGCSALPSTDVTYSVTTTGDAIGEVEYYEVAGFDGAMTMTDDVTTRHWRKSLDGGTAPSIAVHAPVGAETTCTITDGDDAVLVERSGSDGAEVRCELDRSTP